MKRFVALLMACLCLTASCAQAAESYTVAEKLVKQLWAGSGFTGRLQVELARQEGAEEGAATTRPIELDVNYIYVRPTDEEPAQHRADVTLMDGENARSAAYLQLMDGVCSFQADVISPDWYILNEEDQSAETAEQLEAGAESLLEITGVPSLAQTALTFAAALSGADGLAEAIEPYSTRIDIWIEGYRQDAVLGKLDDGTTTMEVSYIVPPAAIKSQMKQMVVDMLSDSTLKNILIDALGEDDAKLFLNPKLRSWYFEVIDQISLDGDLTIDRMVSLKGDTLHLRVALPLYDAKAGNAAIIYDRTGGEADLPDAQTLILESGENAIELNYQTYSSMTGVEVMQGTLRTAKPDAEKAVSFTLRQSETHTVAADGRQVYGYDLTLDAAPAQNIDFSPVQIALTSRFMSKELKSAATEVDATLTLEDEKNSIQLNLHGSSRKKWEPEEIPLERISVHDLTQQDIASILPGAALQIAALFAPMLQSAQ